MNSLPPVCPLCRERCGRFLCPCCGMHNEMPWKCDICEPHTEPCMVVLTLEPAEEKSRWACLIGCLILLVSFGLVAGAITLVVLAITGR